MIILLKLVVLIFCVALYFINKRYNKQKIQNKNSNNERKIYIDGKLTTTTYREDGRNIFDIDEEAVAAAEQRYQNFINNGYIKYNQSPDEDKCKNFEEYKRKMDEYFEKGNKQLALIWDAINEAKETRDYSKVISVYENIYFNEGLYFIGDSHIMRLAEYYYKAERYEDAWRYLNNLRIHIPDLRDKVIAWQIKILKKEKRYIPVVEKTMALYSYNDKTYEQFEKEIRSVVKKLDKDSTIDIKELFKIVEASRRDRNPEIVVHDKLEDYFKRLKLIDF